MATPQPIALSPSPRDVDARSDTRRDLLEACHSFESRAYFGNLVISP